MSLNHRMTALDASFLYLEQPNALCHVGAIFTFARTLEFDRLVTYLEERLPLVPRYTQRAVMVALNLGHPTWEADPDFDIHDHVIRHHLRGHGDDEALARLCAKLFAEPLDRARPLWEMHLIEGYGGGCAVLSKTHRAMIDGAGGVQLSNLLMGASPKPAPLPARSIAKAEALPNPVVHAAEAAVDTVRGQLSLLFNVAGFMAQPARALDEVRQTLDAASTLARTLAEIPPRTPFNGEIGPQRTLGWTRLSLNEVRAIKSRLGGTVNDVVLCVIAGGLRTYLNSRGVEVAGLELKAMVPVSVRSEQEHARLGNRVSMMVAPLPIGIVDPIDRLRHISATMEQLKTSGESTEMERLLALTELLPPMLQRPLAHLQNRIAPVNTICTNVPGPRETRYLLGEPLQQMVPLVPLGAGVGLGFGILSYADQLTIGINAAADRVASAWPVARSLHQAYDDLWGATGLERVRPSAKVEPALNRRARMPTRHPR